MSVTLREERNLTPGPCGTNSVLRRMGFRAGAGSPRAWRGPARFCGGFADRRRDHPQRLTPGFTCQTASTTSRSRRALRASFASNVPPSEPKAQATLKRRGRREDRVRAAPEVSCAKVANRNAHEHTGSAEAVRPSLRNGFNSLFRALPGETRACLSPSPVRCEASSRT